MKWLFNINISIFWGPKLNKYEWFYTLEIVDRAAAEPNNPDRDTVYQVGHIAIK